MVGFKYVYLRAQYFPEGVFGRGGGGGGGFVNWYPV